jgi:magnesium-transporting ATPase (P-type)
MLREPSVRTTPPPPTDPPQQSQPQPHPHPQLYNVVYTAFPVIAHGVLDKDVPRAVARATPALYRDGLEHAFLSTRIFWGWMLEGIAHAALVTFIPIYAFGGFDFLPAGVNASIWDLGTIVFLGVMTVASLRIAQEVVDWQWIVTTLLFASLAVWWLSWVALNWWLSLAPSVFGSLLQLAASGRFWLAFLCAVGACFALSFALEVRDV